MRRWHRGEMTATNLPVAARACLGALVALSTGLAVTTVSAAGATTPRERIERARGSAARAAAAQGALDQLGEDVEREADLEGRVQAHDIIAAARAVRPVTIDRVPNDWVAAGLDPHEAELEDGKLVQTLPNGARVTLTLEPATQRHLEKVYARYKIPYGGLVLIEPTTGRVRAMISQSRAEPDIEGVARKPIAPSASVFKIITAAALLEGEGFSPKKEVCYHGGRSSLTEKNIEGDARLDSRCGDLSDAIAWSINSMIAKLAYQHLTREELVGWAERFGYNTSIPFELPVEASRAEIPEDRHERARTAAGFWHTHLSPLHGALIGATVLNDGVMMRPTLIESYETADGQVLYEFEPRQLRRVMKKSTARQLKSMMQRTTHVGTARKYFRFRNEFPRDVRAGGKTGTLSRKKPSYLGYTWFVGFGEDEEDETIEVAVGGLVCNKPLWHIKGPWAASEAIRKYIQIERDKKKET